jgi:hypothetical protein
MIGWVIDLKEMQRGCRSIRHAGGYKDEASSNIIFVGDRHEYGARG